MGVLCFVMRCARPPSVVTVTQGAERLGDGHAAGKEESGEHESDKEKPNAIDPDTSLYRTLLNDGDVSPENDDGSKLE